MSKIFRRRSFEMFRFNKLIRKKKLVTNLRNISRLFRISPSSEVPEESRECETSPMPKESKESEGDNKFEGFDNLRNLWRLKCL